jgi:hypothetical protein
MEKVSEAIDDQDFIDYNNPEGDSMIHKNIENKFKLNSKEQILKSFLISKKIISGKSISL